MVCERLARTICQFLLASCLLGVGYVYITVIIPTYSSAKDASMPLSFKATLKSFKIQNKSTFGEENSERKRSKLDSDLQVLSMIKDIVGSDRSAEIKPFKELGNITCSGEEKFHGVEDLLCKKPPVFMPAYKNPCWMQDGKFVCLPYFQLIGVAKSGTTDLFSRMLKHPDILPNDGHLRKETFWWSCRRYGHYIDRPHRKGIEDFNRYLAYFHSAASKIKGNEINQIITGDGNPRDVFCMGGWVLIPQNQGLDEPNYITPHLIRHINPAVKLIVLIRDPVERTYSDYYHRQRGSQTPEGFDAAVRKSIAILHACTRVQSLRACLYNRTVQIAFNKQSRIHISFYSVFMKDWLSVFPRKQFLIFQTEDYHRNTSRHMQNVFNFLGVRNLTRSDVDDIAHMDQKRKTEGKQEAGVMLQKTRLILKKLYEPFNIQLAKLLNDGGYLWS